MSLPSYFAANPNRTAAYEQFAKLNRTYLRRREFPNRYNHDVILFERDPLVRDTWPFILDLHGFTANGARRVFFDVMRDAEQVRLPPTPHHPRKGRHPVSAGSEKSGNAVRAGRTEYHSG